MTPEQNESQREFEKFFYGPDMFHVKPECRNIFSKEYKYAHKIWQACEKRLLLSKVKLPERKDDMSGGDGDSFLFEQGFNECLDAIELIPLTNEEIEKLLPDEKTFFETLAKNSLVSFDRDAALKTYAFLRQHIQAAIGGK